MTIILAVIAFIYYGYVTHRRCNEYRTARVVDTRSIGLIGLSRLGYYWMDTGELLNKREEGQLKQTFMK